MAEFAEAEITLEQSGGDNSATAEVLRNLRVLYATVAGEQALDREFGLSLDGTDRPNESAKALRSAEYVRKTQQYEPRARVVRVEWSDPGDGKLKPKVVIALV